MVSDDVPGAADGPPSEPGGDPGAGSRVAGYRLEEQIGRGGMAVVFRARDERLGRLVALKVLAPALARDASFRQRFVRESRAAAAVDDPHIIPIYEAGESDGALYIAMRYVRGGDVGTLVRREGPLPPARAAAIISAAASALDAAHAAGLVHRDVKPANMLLDTQPGRADHVYLSDFGLSKAWQGATRLTSTGLYLGTLEYSAPEQIEGRPLDGRTDQYALGCAAFELLAGEPPFRRDQPVAVMYAQVSAPPPSLCARRAGLPPAVDPVIARALAKSPADRYGSCGELARELRAALGLAPYGDPGGSARPPARSATVLAAPGAVAPAAAAPAGTPPATWPPAGSPPVTAGGGGPGGGASRSRVLVIALAAGLLVAGGVGAAFALAGGEKPHAPQGGTALSHGAPTLGVSTRGASSPAHNAPKQSTSAPGTSADGTPTQSAPASPSASGVALALIKVCTFPADGCTSGSSQQMVTEPAQIVTTGDGSGFLKNLTWTGWGQPTAQGSGLLEIDDCNPNCAQGTFTGYQATVTLSGLTAYGSANQAYADMTVDAPSSPEPQQSFTTGLVP